MNEHDESFQCPGHTDLWSVIHIRNVKILHIFVLVVLDNTEVMF